MLNAHITGEKQRRFLQRLALPTNAIILIIITIMGITTGAFAMSLQDIFQNDPAAITVLTDIRIPRVILSIFVGAALGVCGAAMQALFRNPLADSGLIGVSSGGALGAVVMIVLGNSLFSDFSESLGIYMLPFAAMLGCLGVCALIYRLSNIGPQFTIITLLLAGIAVNAIIGSIIGVLTLMSTDSELRELTFWTMGNLGGNHWALTLPVLVFISISIVGIVRLATPLNLYLLGEQQAQHLGVSVKHLKKQVFFFTALGIGAAVSISGMIGFVGFIVPHLIRLLIGPDHRFLLPNSMLLGASLLTGADIIARTVIIPAELPIGLMTSALGGPFFLLALYRLAKN